MGRRKTTDLDTITTKSRILEAAGNLYLDFGHEKTKMADIAKAVGMSQSNVYRYFPTKSSINEAICDGIVRCIESECLKSIAIYFSQKERLFQLIMTYHRIVMKNIGNNNRLYNMITVAMNEDWNAMRNHQKRMIDKIQNIIERGIASKEFRYVDSYAMAVAVHDAISVYGYPPFLELRTHAPSKKDAVDIAEKYLDHLVNLILYGLMATAPKNCCE